MQNVRIDGVVYRRLKGALNQRPFSAWHRRRDDHPRSFGSSSTMSGELRWFNQTLMGRPRPTSRTAAGDEIESDWREAARVIFQLSRPRLSARRP